MRETAEYCRGHLEFNYLSDATSVDRFPVARFVEVPEATHYLLYDRPQFVADAIDSFICRSREQRSHHE